MLVERIVWVLAKVVRANYDERCVLWYGSKKLRKRALILAEFIR